MTAPLLLLSPALALAQAPAPSSPASPPASLPELAAALIDRIEVVPSAPTGGLLDGPGGWLRAGADCVFVDLVGAGADRSLSWTVDCPSGDATCTWTKRLGPTWSPGDHFTCSRPGSPSGWGGGQGSSAHRRPELVRHDDVAAEWAVAFSLSAGFDVHQQTERPCTAASAAHGAVSPRGPVQRCDTSSGLRVARVHPDLRLGVGVRLVVADAPVDCRQPCPAPPDHARVMAATAWLEGRRFRVAGPPERGLYASEAACRAAPGGAPSPLPEGMCVEAAGVE